MKPVHIFRWVHGFENFPCIHLRGQRELDQDAVNIIAAIQVLDDGKELRSCDGSRRRYLNACKSELFARGDFAFYVDFRGRIVSDENGCESRANSGGSQRGNFASKLRINLIADDVPVEGTRRQFELLTRSCDSVARDMIAHRIV